MSQNIEAVRHYRNEMIEAGQNCEPIRPAENVEVERSLGAQVALHDGIDSLNRLVAKLAAAVETLEEPAVPSVENGLDFYAEVRRFEIMLIQRALKFTGGTQSKAALILKMKHSTLNTKIKNYKLG